VLVCAALVIACGAAFAAPTYVEVPMNGTRQAETVTGFGLPSFFGSAAEYYAVFKLGPFAPGKRYEATLTFDAGTDIGYASAWVDGDPAGKDFASFVGIGTGTGTREMKGKEEKFLFTVDAKSTAAFLFLVVRSNKPWKLGVGVTDRASSLTRDSQDTWGYYYVNDFDFSRTAPFLLTRSGAAAPAAESPASGYVDVQPGQVKKAATMSGWTWMPSYLGGPEGFYALFRLGPLAAGKRYEATLTFDAGTDIGYGLSWLDGDPKGKDFSSFAGIGTGTGTREMKGKESKFLFTVEPKSTAAFLYLVVRSNKPWDISMGLTDRLSGVNRDSQDKWGYYYVTDFDFDRTSPFLLTRGPAK
jgi:hypothetical protein